MTVAVAGAVTVSVAVPPAVPVTVVGTSIVTDVHRHLRQRRQHRQPEVWCSASATVDVEGHTVNRETIIGIEGFMPDLGGNLPGDDKLTYIVSNARLTVGPGSHIYLLTRYRDSAYLRVSLPIVMSSIRVTTSSFTNGAAVKPCRESIPVLVLN